jgi:hypothetical protein
MSVSQAAAGSREDIVRKLALHAADFVRSLPDL